MSLLKIFFFVLGVGASQSIADAVKVLPGISRLAAFVWSLVAQFVVCFLLFVFIDGDPIPDSIKGAIALTVFVRIFYFIKNLKKDG